MAGGKRALCLQIHPAHLSLSPQQTIPPPFLSPQLTIPSLTADVYVDTAPDPVLEGAEEQLAQGAGAVVAAEEQQPLPPPYHRHRVAGPGGRDRALRQGGFVGWLGAPAFGRGQREGGRGGRSTAPPLFSLK